MVVCALSLAMSSSIAAGQGAPPPPAVSVAPVVTRQITETSDYVGRVAAIDKVDIVARVEGFLEQRNFVEGQLVKKGDLLFRIEQDTYKAAVEQARATLAKAKATEVNAKLQLERGKELVRNNNIPQATVDQRQADQDAAQAGVLEAQAALDQAQINLGYTEIRSPIDGRIGIAAFTVGNLVDSSSGKLATIVSQDPVYVVFQASERDVLEYKRRKAALLVPQSAVLLDQAGRYVLVVDQEKKVEQRRVTTGIEQGRDVVVMEGLKPGELVIVEGIQKVRPGQIVAANVVPAN
jgi:membrane fusion protein (multidrug efflux system)